MSDEHQRREDDVKDLNSRVSKIEGKLETFNIVEMATNMGEVSATVRSLETEMRTIHGEIKDIYSEIKKALEQFHKHEKDSERFKGKIDKDIAVNKVVITIIYGTGATVTGLILKFIFFGFGG
jgi:peptidoglycan hydrolase CwlO-like protein